VSELHFGRRIRGKAVLIALSLAVVPRLMAQCTCEGSEYPLWPEPQGPFVWGIVQEVGSGAEGRIAVVVDWEMYQYVSGAISTFTDDLVGEGHRVMVVLGFADKALRPPLDPNWLVRIAHGGGGSRPDKQVL
jgi:hypothetical protein